MDGSKSLLHVLTKGITWAANPSIC